MKIFLSFSKLQKGFEQILWSLEQPFNNNAMHRWYECVFFARPYTVWATSQYKHNFIYFIFRHGHKKLKKKCPLYKTSSTKEQNSDKMNDVIVKSWYFAQENVGFE